MIRTLTVLFIGLALLVFAFLLLDVDLTKRTIALFIALPIGALCAAFGIWQLASAYVQDE